MAFVWRARKLGCNYSVMDERASERRVFANLYYMHEGSMGGRHVRSCSCGQPSMQRWRTPQTATYARSSGCCRHSMTERGEALKERAKLRSLPAAATGVTERNCQLRQRQRSRWLRPNNQVREIAIPAETGRELREE